MRKKYITALAASAVLAMAAPTAAQAAEGGGSYAAAAPQAQQTNAGTCTGTVTDNDGEPLPGATV